MPQRNKPKAGSASADGKPQPTQNGKTELKKDELKTTKKTAAAAAKARNSKSKTTATPFWLAIAAVIAVAAVALQMLLSPSGGLLASVLGGGAEREPPPRPTETAQRAAAATAAKSTELPKDYAPPKKLPQSRPKEPKGTADCHDETESCEAWASAGECERNAAYMKASCRLSCGECNLPPGTPRPPPFDPNACEDKNANCATWASIGECDTNPNFMKVQCRVTCRLCQSATCRDIGDDCAARAEKQGCYTKPNMREECAWTCLACDLTQAPACARDAGETPAAVQGSVNAMFTKVAADPRATVHHAPAAYSADGADGPWVVTIDDFLSEEEAKGVLSAGSRAGTGWQRSLAGDGVQTARTSSTSWCRGKCLEDGTMKAVQARVEALTGVPQRNCEYMQLLQYEAGQYYNRHHDQNSPRSSAWGPRLYTFFIYLNSEGGAEGLKGGATHFPVLNLTVTPKTGRALLWTSVTDDDPFERDDRTDHEALKVEAGTKYAANYWLHMYPFRGKSDRCENIAYADNWY